MSRKIGYIVIALLTLTALSGSYFAREFVFINTNSQIKYLDDVSKATLQGEDPTLLPNWTHSKMEAFFENASRGDISTFKWWMTLGFTGLFACITAIGVRLMSDTKMAFLSLLFYACLFLIAFLLSFISYRVGRDIIGLLHSPVPFLLMLCILYFNKIQLNHGE